MTTLSEVKIMVGDKASDAVYETAECFIFNCSGKYRPNITYVLPKDVGKDDLMFRSGAEVNTLVADMNVRFGGTSYGVKFGDFWVSKKGSRCFRPLPPAKAKHILVEASWGGCFNKDRGSREMEPVGELYYRRASSNGGGSGYDYWVFPVGFKRILRNEEFDGPAPVEGGQPTDPEMEERARAIRAQFSELDRLAAEAAKAKAEAEAIQKAADEAASIEAKPALESRLLEVAAMAEAAGYEHGLVLGPVTWAGEAQYGGIGTYYYRTKEVEEYVQRITARVAQKTFYEKNKKQRAEWEPKIRAAYEAAAGAIGYWLRFSDMDVTFRDKESWGESHVRDAFSEKGFVEVGEKLEKLKQIVEFERARLEWEPMMATLAPRMEALGLRFDFRTEWVGVDGKGWGNPLTKQPYSEEGMLKLTTFLEQKEASAAKAKAKAEAKVTADTAAPIEEEVEEVEEPVRDRTARVDLTDLSRLNGLFGGAGRLRGK